MSANPGTSARMKHLRAWWIVRSNAYAAYLLLQTGRGGDHHCLYICPYMHAVTSCIGCVA